jgi:hypothetical protein
MTNTMAPLLYNSYPVEPSVTIAYRNPDSLGVKPLRAVWLYNMQENYILSEADISSGTSTPKSGAIKILYYLSYFSYWDFMELRDKAAHLVVNGNSPSSVSRLLNATGYTDLVPGSYPVNINYALPGTGQVTTQKQIVIHF